MLDHEPLRLPAIRETTKTLARSNELLDALPSGVRKRLQERTRVVCVQEVLFDCHRQDVNVFFPKRNTVISLVRSTDEGPQVEVGMVGSEGFASLDVMLERGTHSETAAIVQAGGEITCISSRYLHAEFSTDLDTRMLITAYAGMFLEHVSQTAVCNGVHTIAQRLAKWLLALRERTGSNELIVSHESLSRILGTQRSAVTLAIGALTIAEVISHSRRSIHLRNIAALRARACACFESMTDSLAAFRVQLESRKK
jgi:hypothetical protein